jgi:catalase (peroxidase I)
LFLAVSFSYIAMSGKPDDTVLKDLQNDLKNTIIQHPTNKNYTPVVVRFGWHGSGTFDKNGDACPITGKTGSCPIGGSQGCTIRFSPEIDHDANAGLKMVTNLLDPVYQKYKDHISVSDFYIYATCLVICWASDGNCPMTMKWGRKDATQGSQCAPEGRLPDAMQGVPHLRDIFHRQGFTDRDIVTLSGAHTLGSCHTDRSGFEGPWTSNPLKLDNDYYKLLLNEKWTKREWSGPEQYTDSSGKLMMLISDLALLEEPSMKAVVEEYAKDEKKFFADFGRCFSQMLNNGISGDAVPVQLFGKKGSIPAMGCC